MLSRPVATQSPSSPPLQNKVNAIPKPKVLKQTSPHSGNGFGILKPEVLKQTSPHSGNGFGILKPKVLKQTSPHSGNGFGILKPKVLKQTSPHSGNGFGILKPKVLKQTSPHSGNGFGILKPEVLKQTSPHSGNGFGILKPKVLKQTSPHSGNGFGILKPKVLEQTSPHSGNGLGILKPEGLKTPSPHSGNGLGILKPPVVKTPGSSGRSSCKTCDGRCPTCRRQWLLNRPKIRIPMSDNDRKNVAEHVAREIQLCAGYGVQLKLYSCASFWEGYYLEETYRPIVLPTLIKNFNQHVKSDIWKAFKSNSECQLWIASYFGTPITGPRQKVFEDSTGIKMSLNAKNVPTSWILPTGKQVIGYSYFKEPRVSKIVKKEAEEVKEKENNKKKEEKDAVGAKKQWN